MKAPSAPIPLLPQGEELRLSVTGSRPDRDPHFHTVQRPTLPPRVLRRWEQKERAHRVRPLSNKTASPIFPPMSCLRPHLTRISSGFVEPHSHRTEHLPLVGATCCRSSTGS